MQQKACRKCGDTKDLDQFGRQTSTKDGYKYFCKSCIAASNKRRYQKDPERHKTLVKNWQKKNKSKVKAYKKSYLDKKRANGET